MSTVTTYPMLQKAWLEMVTDQGMEVKDCPFPSKIGSFLVEDLITVDNELSRLTEAEIETLSAGDQNDWLPIYDKIGENGVLVHGVLEGLFDKIMNWEGDDE